MSEYADMLEHESSAGRPVTERTRGVETRTWDSGEYEIDYLYDDGVVTEIVGYKQDGFTITEDELAREFTVMGVSQLQEEIDEEFKDNQPCQCRGDNCYC